LNKCIIRRNQLCEKLGKKRYISGIIIHLSDSKSYTSLDIKHFTIKCNVCGHVDQVLGSEDADVFAPPKCAKCGTCSFGVVKPTVRDGNPTSANRPTCCNIM
jgi:hypothetical protein